jgi:hypothetical protein
MEVPKADHAFYECPRYATCSANECPLDMQMFTRFSLPGEDDCRAHRSTRVAIAASYSDLPTGGLTRAEIILLLRWQRRPSRLAGRATLVRGCYQNAPTVSQAALPPLRPSYPLSPYAKPSHCRQGAMVAGRQGDLDFASAREPAQPSPKTQAAEVKMANVEAKAAEQRRRAKQEAKRLRKELRRIRKRAFDSGRTNLT